MRTSIRISNIWIEFTQIKDKPVLIAMDAKSSLWCSNDEDHRRETLSAWIIRNSMTILNEPDNLTTSDSIHGQANIDISIANSRLVTRSFGR